MAITEKEQKWRNQFGENLRKAMFERGITQLQLACEINKSQGDISNLISGKFTPSAYTVYKIAGALRVTPNQLCGIPTSRSQWEEKM